MEKEHLDRLISMIKNLEKKNLDFDKYLSSLNILSRNNMLKEIISDIIKNNKFFQSIQFKNGDVYLAKDELENFSSETYIKNLILKIQNEPSKKIIILREFFNRLDGISESDLNVILKSLKNKNNEDLNKELLNLISIFNMKSLK